MAKKDMKEKNICIYCGRANCNCSKIMKVVTFVIGIIFLWVAWSLWTGAWSLEEINHVIEDVWGLKKILLSFTKACC